jgi:hypothetical protein
LNVEAPGRQDAEAQEYQTYFELPQRSRTGWIDVQNVKLFLSEPQVLRALKMSDNKGGGEHGIQEDGKNRT